MILPSSLIVSCFGFNFTAVITFLVLGLLYFFPWIWERGKITLVKLEVMVCTVPAKWAVLIMSTNPYPWNFLKSCQYVRGKIQGDVCWKGNWQGWFFPLHSLKVTGWGERWCRAHFTRHESFLFCGAVFHANLELPQAADTFKWWNWVIPYIHSSLSLYLSL